MIEEFDPKYARLVSVLKAAYEQAAIGKGKERHAHGRPFDEQPMQVISRLLRSENGMAYQAIKKITEGLNLPTHERRVAELLGAINYLAGIVIYLEDSEGVGAQKANKTARAVVVTPALGLVCEEPKTIKTGDLVGISRKTGMLELSTAENREDLYCFMTAAEDLCEPNVQIKDEKVYNVYPEKTEPVILCSNPAWRYEATDAEGHVHRFEEMPEYCYPMGLWLVPHPARKEFVRLDPTPSDPQHTLTLLEQTQ